MNHSLIKISASVLAVAVGTCSMMAELRPDVRKDKYGYVNDAGELIIGYIYQEAMPFVDGKAKVKKNNKWGYIDENGNPLVALVYDEIQPFVNGMARVVKGGKYGYIRSNGTYVIKPEYDFIGSFNDNGYCWVGKGKTLSAASKGLYHDNVMVIAPGLYTSLGFFFNNGVTNAADGNPINVANVGEITSNFCRLSVSDVPYVWASTAAGLSAIFDTAGNIVAPLAKGTYGAPKSGAAMLMVPGSKKTKFNYYTVGANSAKLFKKDIEILTDNLTKTPPYPFVGNLAAVPSNYGKYQLIDKTGNAVGGVYDVMIPVQERGYIVSADGKYGVLDSDGNEKVSLVYDNIVKPKYEDEEPVFAALNSSKMCGYIDMSGNVLVPFEYDNVLSMRRGRGYVKKGELWGVVNTSNKILVKPAWEDVIMCQNVDDTHMWVQAAGDKKWYVHSLATDTHSVAQGYDKCRSFDTKGRAVALSNDLAGVIDVNGKVIVPFRFSSMDIAADALAKIDSENKDVMSEIEAYRINIKLNPDRNKFRLFDVIDDNMWDF